MAKRRKQKRNSINMRNVLFLVLVIYIGVHLVTFLFKTSIDVYEVKTGKIVNTKSLTGLVVREETLVKADDDGYITFFAPDQSKVYNGEIIYTLDEDGKIKEYISEQIAAKKKTKKKNMKKVAGIIEEFQDNYNPVDFDAVYSTKQKLDNTVLNTNEEYIQKALEKFQTEEQDGEVHSYEIGRSTLSGVLSMNVDEFEKQKMSQVKSSDLNKDSYHQTRLMSNALVKKDDVICRIVTSENWGMVVELTKKQYKELEKLKSVKVTFAQNSVKCNAGINCRQQGRKYYAELSFNKFMIRFINDRFLDVELSIDESTGYKIPKSAVKEDEFYKIPKSYLMKGGNSKDKTLLVKGPKDEKASTLKGVDFYTYADNQDDFFIRKKDLKKKTVVLSEDGNSEQLLLDETVKKPIVFCVNEGYAEMRIVDIIGKEDDYYLIKTNTPDGVKIADHIASNYKDVNENRIIY